VLYFIIILFFCETKTRTRQHQYRHQQFIIIFINETLQINCENALFFFISIFLKQNVNTKKTNTKISKREIQITGGIKRIKSVNKYQSHTVKLFNNFDKIYRQQHQQTLIKMIKSIAE
jgi:hypothetical protein